MRKNSLVLLISVAVIFFLAVFYTYGASTISTNINTGGTLTVSGATSLNGNATLGDAAADVILSTGGFQASSTALFGGASTFYANATISGAYGLVLGSSGSDITGSAGMIYYNSTNKTVRLNDGTNWFTLGTTTTGWSLNDPRLFPADMAYYLTIGTSTQQGLSMLTLEASSTAAIPLTIVARSSQSANLLNVRNSTSVNLLYINSAGALFASSTLQVTGAQRNYGALTVDGALTASGDLALTTASSTGLAKFTNASSTLFTSMNHTNLGDAAGDVLTIGGDSVVMSTNSTTTIPNGEMAAWTIATSTSIATPTLTISTVSSPAGRIGIGTSTPSTELDVNGYIRVLRAATTSDCSTNLEGAIFYNDANNFFWGCDGTNWTRLY